MAAGNRRLMPPSRTRNRRPPSRPPVRWRTPAISPCKQKPRHIRVRDWRGCRSSSHTFHRIRYRDCLSAIISKLVSQQLLIFDASIVPANSLAASQQPCRYKSISKSSKSGAATSGTSIAFGLPVALRCSEATRRVTCFALMRFVRSP